MVSLEEFAAKYGGVAAIDGYAPDQAKFFEARLQTMGDYIRM